MAKGYWIARVDVADGEVPVPIGKEVAAGQTPHAGVKLLEQSDGVGPEALDVIRRHE